MTEPDAAESEQRPPAGLDRFELYRGLVQVQLQSLDHARICGFLRFLQLVGARLRLTIVRIESLTRDGCIYA